MRTLDYDRAVDTILRVAVLGIYFVSFYATTPNLRTLAERWGLAPAWLLPLVLFVLVGVMAGKAVYGGPKRKRLWWALLVLLTSLWSLLTMMAA